MWHFNTSYVVIKRTGFFISYGVIRISIHLMLLLNGHGINKHMWGRFISIHLMLLLNFHKTFTSYFYKIISIHLMLLLNANAILDVSE